MAIYACNEEGIEALNTMASGIVIVKDKILELTSKMQSEVDRYSGTIGPHEKELTEALQEIYDSLNSASEPIGEISDILRSIADGYEDEVNCKVLVRKHIR